MRSDQSNPSHKAIGIDLGTTFCCVSIYWNGKVEVIPGNSGDKTLPSVAVFEDGTLDTARVGKPAIQKMSHFPTLTVFDAKRIIGRQFNDPSVADFQLRNPLLKVVDHRGMAAFQLTNKNKEILEVTPEQVCSHFLRALKEASWKFSGEEITDAVITVPANFNDSQRSATKTAAEMAGLKVLRLLNEPTAAALAYAANRPFPQTPETTVVVDFGGGTIDVTVMTSHNQNMEINSSHGDCWVGGRDVDHNIFKFLESKRLFDNIDMRKHYFKLVAACQELKIELSMESSQNGSTVIEVGSDEPLELDIMRQEFERINEQVFRKVIACMDEAIKGAKLSKDQIDHVLLVGGSGRILKVREMIMQYFNGRITPNAQIHPDEAISVGAAILAAKIKGVAPLANIPELFDVLNHSVGIGLHNGSVSHVVRKNTRIPAQGGSNYQTSVNNQTSINIVVCEGEGTKIAETTVIGFFTIEGIPPKPKGDITIQVTFHVSEDGILTVTAQCNDNHNLKKSLIIERHLSMISCA